MDEKLRANIRFLRETSEWLGSTGLILDRPSLSHDLRLALFAIQTEEVEKEQKEKKRLKVEKIGFGYPNPR